LAGSKVPAGTVKPVGKVTPSPTQRQATTAWLGGGNAVVPSGKAVADAQVPK
jgi:hypothetical protein